MTLQDIKAAIQRTDWNFLADCQEMGTNRCIVSVDYDEADECLAAIRDALPEGASAVFGSGCDTDAWGDTTVDIVIEWEAV